jgi:hypothetical protein
VPSESVRAVVDFLTASVVPMMDSVRQILGAPGSCMRRYRYHYRYRYRSRYRSSLRHVALVLGQTHWRDDPWRWAAGAW